MLIEIIIENPMNMDGEEGGSDDDGQPFGSGEGGADGEEEGSESSSEEETSSSEEEEEGDVDMTDNIGGETNGKAEKMDEDEESGMWLLPFQPAFKNASISLDSYQSSPSCMRTASANNEGDGVGVRKW